jgi:hypothetical protein
LLIAWYQWSTTERRQLRRFDASVKLVEMMHRAMAMADIEPISRGDGSADIGFRTAYGSFQICPLRALGSDGR